ncbi:MAG TPA: hypothetical protein VKE41_24135 [Roseiflexaceae bacterium]|nr:hypothetical protein [Roseiflexaceae bacterium]
MKRKHFCIAVTTALALLFAMASSTAAHAHAPAPPPAINPANFVRHVTNTFFPLRPGTTFFYMGEKEGVPNTNQVSVTHATKRILGVTTTVVHDQVFEAGVLSEDTFDWYAQDVAGNVWYFGEDTKELDPSGHVISTEGTWQAGVDGAQPGIIMEAHPHVGDRYQQEFAAPVAEDMAQVRSRDGSACVRYGCFDDLLVTKEWTPLERGVVENKYYAQGIGVIREVVVKGGDERSELVRITERPEN